MSGFKTGHVLIKNIMKKHFLLILASTFAICSNAQTFKAEAAESTYFAYPAISAPMEEEPSEYVTWGYCDNNIQYSIGVNEEYTMSSAILINRDDMKDFKDAEIVGIRIGVADLSKNVSVFMKTGNADNISFELPDVVKKNAGNKSMGFHDILFDSPKKVTDQYIIAGYTATGKNNIGYDGGTTHADACYVCIDNEWGSLYETASQNNWGSVCIQILLSGENLPEREMKMEKIITKNVEQNQPFTLSGIVSNLTTTPVNNYEISYSFNNGQSYTQSIDCDINALEADTFNIEIKEPLTKIGSNAVMVKIETVNGGDDTDITNNAIVHPINCIEEGCYYPRTIVMEESTSVYCGYCPKGIVVMRSWKQRFPDQFIGIAIHSSSMGSDPMVVYDYDEDINGIYKSEGLPNCIINRLYEYQGDPILMEIELEEILEKFTMADAKIWFESVSDLENNQITAKVKAKFAKSYNDANYRIAFVLLENQVESTVGQLNYFSGSGDSGMGGFENLPQLVDMPFDDVARGIWDFDGIGGSLPETIVKKEVYEYEATLDLTEKNALVQKKENLEVVAMIIDFYTGEIVNAAKISLKNGSGIENTAEENLVIYAEDNKVNVKGQYDKIEVFGLNGMKVNNENLERGVYLVKVTTGNNIVVRKVSVR